MMSRLDSNKSSSHFSTIIISSSAVRLIKTSHASVASNARDKIFKPQETLLFAFLSHSPLKP